MLKFRLLTVIGIGLIMSGCQSVTKLSDEDIDKIASVVYDKFEEENNSEDNKNPEDLQVMYHEIKKDTYSDKVIGKIKNVGSVDYDRASVVFKVYKDNDLVDCVTDTVYYLKAGETWNFDCYLGDYGDDYTKYEFLFVDGTRAKSTETTTTQPTT